MNNKNEILTFDKMEFAKYEAPQFREKIDKQKDWVKFGDDNQFPEYLKTLISKSPRHAAIIKKKAMLIGGRGFNTTNLEMRTMTFLKNFNDEFDLDEILYKISFDLELYGGFALNIIWSKDRSQISSIHYIDPSKIRVQPFNIDEDKSTDVEGYWVSDGWEDTRKYPPVLYSGFSTVNRKNASQIFYVKAHRPGTEYYAIPDYLPAIFWMELEWKISEFHLANVVNGFVPSFHINWPLGNNMPDEEMDSLINRLKARFGNAINAGESFITFMEDTNKPTITPIESNSSDKKFIQLDEIIEKGIMHSHRINNPSMFGLGDGGKSKLGESSNANERNQSAMEFEIDYVIPQQHIIEKVFNKIARINGITDKLMINRYSDSFKKVGGDSVTDVLAIISNDIIQPAQKYFLLVSLNYTHDLASKLSGYTEGNDLKHKPSVLKDSLVTSDTTTTTTVDNKTNITNE
jgi:hypothetical protein